MYNNKNLSGHFAAIQWIDLPVRLRVRIKVLFVARIRLYISEVVTPWGTL